MVRWNDIKESTIRMLRLIGFNNDDTIILLLEGKIKHIICNNDYLEYLINVLNDECIGYNIEPKNSKKSYVYIVSDNELQGYF